VLADWHPIVAGWDDDLGWRTDPPTSQGDPTFADIGLYDLTVTLPQGYQVIATGIEQTVEALSSTTDQVSITSGPARDLTLLVSDTLIPTEGVAGETVVRVWANPDPDGQAAALWVLTESIAALNAWGERYGAYPAIELDLVATPVQQAVLGVSWSGLVMLSDTLLLVDTAWIERDPETARFAIVHEIGHQWWGNMIGANSNDHPFMVEGLTNALSIDIAQDLYGRDVALGMLEAQMAGRYRDALLRFGDDVVDQPVGAENPNGPGRAALAYGKGALGFLAIRLEMGDDAWFAAMRAFADQYLYTNAEPADLLAVLIAHAPPGVEVEALWIRWFEEADTTVEEIDALFAGMAQRLLDAA
jgi:aminopeptidase N